MSRKFAGALKAMEVLLGAASILCLLLLARRAALGLELRWDAWWYHIPFAARYGGLDIPYEMGERAQTYFQGFPPLPHLLMGGLWRLTGSIHATGVINYLAFLTFLIVCHRKLRAPFFLVCLIALTAPLVLIHAATSYVDLFANCLLAIGLCTLTRVYLFDLQENGSLLLLGLAGVSGAAWSKAQLVPVVVLALLLFALVYRPWRAGSGPRRTALAIGLATLLAAAPYLKNLLVYGNPVWPVEFPVLTHLFPNGGVSLGELVLNQRPPMLLDASQFEVFVRSLFEIGHPTHYPNRHRWIIDQGSAWVAFRSGGLWNVAVVAYLLLTGGMLLYLAGRKGKVVAGFALALLCVVGLLPQSHELRYYLFMPLCWAGIIGMLYPLLKQRQPLLCLPVLLLVAGLFVYVSRINLPYYKTAKRGYLDAARVWGADIMWPYLKPGFTFCAVNREPTAIFLTGPTMREFRIVDRTEESHCPTGSVPIRGNMVYYNERSKGP